MTDTERYGTRDLTYSNWHRIASISRFVGATSARRLTMIDLDGLEYCNVCREAVGVVEVARDVGQRFKASTVTAKLAHRLGVPGLLVFYSPSPDKQISGHPDIEAFRARIIAPAFSPEHYLTPQQFARWIERLHNRCACKLVIEDVA